MSEQDNEAGELNKTKEVLSVEFPADEYAALPLYPGEEAQPYVIIVVMLEVGEDGPGPSSPPK